MLKEGQKAPDFTVTVAPDQEINLADFRGGKVVVYFYPKDNTPGCATEACSIRDHFTGITELGAVVIGISPDSIKSHRRFLQTHALPFYLGSDPDHEIAKSFGAWGEKRMYGRTHVGILRSTFIIDEEGTIAKVFAKVKTAVHGEELLEFLKRL